jgi:hypothetical protein
MCSSKTKYVFLCGPNIIPRSLVTAREITAHFHNFSYVGSNESNCCNVVFD